MSAMSENSEMCCDNGDTDEVFSEMEVKKCV